MYMTRVSKIEKSAFMGARELGRVGCALDH